MRLDKFTQRGQEAILAAQELAQTYNHSQIEPEHLLLALLQQPDGVVPEVITQVGANPAVVQSQLEADLARRPKVYGGNAQPGVSGSLGRVIQDAQSEAAAMHDEYVSTEHLLLALAGQNGEGAAKLLARPASRATASWPASPRSAAASASPARTRRPPTRRWRSTAAT